MDHPQTWNFARAGEYCSWKNFVRLWKYLWNSLKLGCGTEFFDNNPQNAASFPQTGTFKAIFP